jgi:hypothetical protein
LVFKILRSRTSEDFEINTFDAVSAVDGAFVRAAAHGEAGFIRLVALDSIGANNGSSVR